MKSPVTLLKDAKAARFSIISICSILLAVLIIYRQDLSILANEALQNDATSHIILVPFLVSFLIYRKRDLAKASLAMDKLRVRTQVITLSEIAGFALCLFALLLYWYGSYTFYPLEYHVASLTIFLMGITLTLFNTKMLMTLLFPILFVGFLAPPPSDITVAAGAALGNFNAEASYTLLKTLGVPVNLTSEYGPPTILVNSPSGVSAQFAVNQACSGIYSLIAFAMFAAFLIYIVKEPYRKKILLLPIGFIMLPILNILRISLIVLIAHKISEEIAMTIFHTFSGWLMLSAGIILLLLLAEKLLHMKISESKSTISNCDKCSDTSKGNESFCSHCGAFRGNSHARVDNKFLIKMTALLLASCVVALSFQAPVFAFAPGLTLTNTDLGASTAAFPQVSGYNLSYLYRDESFERISHTDASILYIYFPVNVSDPSIYMLVGVGSSITNLHNWESCLFTWQTAQGYAPAATVIESKDVQLMENPPIIAKSLIFQYPASRTMFANYIQVTLYWYQTALFRMGLTVESRYVRISLIVLTTDRTNLAEMKQKLFGLGQAITSQWEPVRIQSIPSLSIPAMQLLLGSAIASAIFLQTTEYSRKWRTRSANLRIFERYGSPNEKLLLKKTKELRQETKETTTKNIESFLKENSPNSTNCTDLFDTLENLRKNGILQLDIINFRDQPKLVWKP